MMIVMPFLIDHPLAFMGALSYGETPTLGNRE